LSHKAALKVNEEYFSSSLPVFNRDQNRIELTKSGQILSRYVKNIDSLYQRTIQEIRENTNQVAGDIHLGTASLLGENLSYDNSLREFFKRHFKAEPEDPVHYDLVINTGRFSFQAVTSSTKPKASFGINIRKRLE
jgi:DNA-binding transcriptional LysR family regulator